MDYAILGILLIRIAICLFVGGCLFVFLVIRFSL